VLDRICHRLLNTAKDHMSTCWINPIQIFR
jgi:hypothetical protein